MTSRLRRTKRGGASRFALALLAGASVAGSRPAGRRIRRGSRTERLTQWRIGVSAAFWKPYIPMALPPVDAHNGSRLEQHLATGSLKLSLRQFLQLVAENNVDLLATRYNFAIAHMDILRARLGPGGARGRGGTTTGRRVRGCHRRRRQHHGAAVRPGGTGGAAS